MLTSPKKLIILEQVDSTNNYAMAMVQNGVANSGDAVFAHNQTAGKGRRMKAWESNPGENIILTILSEMQWLPVPQQFRLSVAVSLACFHFFSNHIKENIKIKWPNDIFLRDRKAGGILIENVIKGNLWQWAVIGIGLNINQEIFDPENFAATSLRRETGKKYDVIALAAELHSQVINSILRLQNESFHDVLQQYNQHLFRRNESVKLKKGNVAFETTIKSVSSLGDLITQDVIERKFHFDEVEWQLNTR